MMRRGAVLSAVALASLLTGCSSGGSAVAVTATDTKCTPAKTDFSAGKTTFAVTNKGSKVTELYVYAPGDVIAGEVENVGPGAARKLGVDLKAGTYELACKPGMTGRGIRVPITVTGGEKQSAPAVAGRNVEVHAVDFSFQFADPQIKTGESVKFELINDGTQPHELEVIGAGRTVGEVAPINAGTRGDATMTFDKPGVYEYQCDVADHRARGMHGTFRVS
jgi:iron uptake system component EfeO